MALSIVTRVTRFNPGRAAVLRMFARVASAGVVLIPCVVLAGWLTDNEALKRIHPGFVAMNPLTAVLFIFAGVALWRLLSNQADQWQAVVQAVGGLMALAGLLALGSILLGRSGVDQWLFHDKLGIGSKTPNRMSPTTAVDFVLMGLALLLAHVETTRGARPAQFLALTAWWIALLAAVGYLYGTTSLYQVKTYVPMALHTAGTFLLFASGFLCARADRGLVGRVMADSAGGAMVRRLGLMILGIPIALGWLMLVGEKHGLYDATFRFSVFVVLLMVIFSLIIWTNARSLDVQEDERDRATTDLRAAHAELEGRVGERTAALAQVLAEISEGMTVLSASAAQIVQSSTQFAAGVADTAAAVVQTTTTVEELRQTAQVSSEKAQKVAQGAQNASYISQTGKKSLEEMGAVMARIQEQMESIGERMMRLDEQSQTISQIIATVEDLSQQSNLLAVNAAIEAAKAGDYGKGFAVVAQEVRSLAEQSKQATTQVRTILGDIQKATRDAVTATEHGSEAVEAGVAQSAQAGEAILTLADSVSVAAQATLQIAASSRQQLAGMDQVALAMGQVKQVSIQNSDSASQLEESTRSLNTLGQRLKHLVEQYH